MHKQTVAERYEQQQAMTGQLKSSVDAKEIQSTQLQQKFKQLEEALKQAHQSVAQLQTVYPTQPQLNEANQRMNFAATQLQELKSSTPELLLGLPIATQQQITQLGHQIQQASHTLQYVQKSIQSQ